jgi:phosphoribosylformylglycinamidine synthase
MFVSYSNMKGLPLMKSDAIVDRLNCFQGQVALRYLDHLSRVTQTYPRNPNGSREGISGLTNKDGRFLIMMPHPERVYRTLSHSWHPETWGDESPWFKMFENARDFVEHVKKT